MTNLVVEITDIRNHDQLTAPVPGEGFRARMEITPSCVLSEKLSLGVNIKAVRAGNFLILGNSELFNCSGHFVNECSKE